MTLLILLLLFYLYLLGIVICYTLLESIRIMHVADYSLLSTRDKCIIVLLLISSWVGVFYISNKTKK